MTDDEDNPLQAIDLGAWTAPTVADQGDAVIARMRAPSGVGAIETVQRKRSARTWVAAGAGAAAIASIAVIVVSSVGSSTTQSASGSGSGSASESGGLLAVRAEHVQIGASSVELDPGAELHWNREGSRVVARQPKGAATWRVDDRDTFVIDAGATVASVEASGASLRVEVHMSPLEARVVGTSAATAAAVAVITVLVYRGTANVGAANTVVGVPAGTTVEITPGKPPKVQDVIAQNASLQRRAAELEEQLRIAKAQLDAAGVGSALGPALPGGGPSTQNGGPSSGSGSAGQRGYDPFATPRGTGRIPDSLDRAAISATIDGIKDRLRACDDGSFTGTLQTRVVVGSSGRVTSLRITPKPAFEACFSAALRSARFPTTKSGGTFNYPFAFTAPAVTANATCDVDALKRRAQDHISRGEYAAATTHLEAAYKCQPNAGIANLLFFTACNAKNKPLAQRYFSKITSQNLQQRCIANGIILDPTPPSPPATTATTGTLKVLSEPVGARIVVDGREVGVAPLTVTLTPGKHKVTYVLGADRYTFSVKIEAGKTETLKKDLTP